MTYPTLAGFQRRFDERVMQCLQDAGLGKLAEGPAGLDLQHEASAPRPVTLITPVLFS